MSLTVEIAQRMIEASHAKARELGVGVSTAIYDGDGRRFAFARMPEAHWFSIEMAESKAFTGALLRRDGPEVKEMRPEMLAAVSTMQGRALLASSSITVIVADGQVVAAIGCSGATEDEDAQCAHAARAAYLG